MKLVIILFSVLLLVGSASADVESLQTSNFDDFIKSNEIALIKFHAPWCGHCKKLVPEFEKAEKNLTGTMALAEVDCTKENNICSRFSVSGFPTMLLFINGTMTEKYDGLREASAIINYAKALSDPIITEVNSHEEFEKIKNEGRSICLVKTDSVNSELAEIVKKIAFQFRNSFRFVLTTKAEISPDDAVESVTVYRVGDEKETFDDKASADALLNFFEKAIISYLGAITPQTMMKYSVFAKKPMGWLFLSSKNRDSALAEVLPLAKKYRKDLVMLWVDTEVYGAVGKQMGIPDNAVYPGFVIDINRRHHIQPESLPFSVAAMEDFIQKFLKGDTKPFLKSEEIPERETEDGLTTLVGKTLESYLSKGKNIMIYFHAPWCGQCKKFTPIYNKFAKANGSKDLIIAKIDATLNDFDTTKFTVEGYPTIFFITAEGQEIIEYDDARTVAALESFVKNNMKNNTYEESISDNDL